MLFSGALRDGCGRLGRHSVQLASCGMPAASLSQQAMRDQHNGQRTNMLQSSVMLQSSMTVSCRALLLGIMGCAVAARAQRRCIS